MSALLQLGVVDVTTGLLLCARDRRSASSCSSAPVRPPSKPAAAAPAAGRRPTRRSPSARAVPRAVSAPRSHADGPRRRYDAADAPDGLGGGAAAHLHGRRAGAAPSRRRAPPERARGDRADLRRDARGGAGRRHVRRRSRRPGGRRSRRRGHARRARARRRGPARGAAGRWDAARRPGRPARLAAPTTPDGPGRDPCAGDRPPPARGRERDAELDRPERRRRASSGSRPTTRSIGSTRGWRSIARPRRLPPRPAGRRDRCAGRRARRRTSRSSGSAATAATRERPPLPRGAPRPLRPDDRRPRSASRDTDLWVRVAEDRQAPGDEPHVGLRQDHPRRG